MAINQLKTLEEERQKNTKLLNKCIELFRENKELKRKNEILRRYLNAK